ncbi:MAG: coproporphyrinogen III oxidase, partial [Mycobacteriaceae bacterium]|nr:coproporphyrinogen III oxidase [Mycobacteriaceae bacterium]
AHGFIGDVRWWNVKHPDAYAQRVSAGDNAIDGFETLDRRSRHYEDVLLGIRLRSGLETAVLSESERRRAEQAVGDGLLAYDGDRLVLTERGRLLADGVVRDILDR